MAKSALKPKLQPSQLSDEEGLSIEVLDGIAGGAVGVSKPTEASNNADIGSAIDAAPAFERRKRARPPRFPTARQPLRRARPLGTPTRGTLGM